MADWSDNLTPDERKEWDDFVRRVREDLVLKVAESAFVAPLVPGGDFDVKFAVELGTAIMLDKPIVPVVFPGRKVPPGLRRIAHAVIELEHDLDTEAGQLEMQRRLSAVMDEMGLT
jgi:hypothetical protein